jgi:glycyl-tRNA synthetase
MSKALYKTGGLRFWSEFEIRLRDRFVDLTATMVRETLTEMNPAWSMRRMEGPVLTPAEFISPEYSSDDVFETNHSAGGQPLRLRAETTASSYLYARWLINNDRRCKLPLCVWQVGKSFRRETNDGASASKMRFNEFYQLEFQCIYAQSTKADYRGRLIDAVRDVLFLSCGLHSSVEPSDRVPSYAESTIDIVSAGTARAFELASCSIRTDFGEDVRVCEIAIGLDRVVDLSAEGYEVVS